MDSYRCVFTALPNQLKQWPLHFISCWNSLYTVAISAIFFLCLLRCVHFHFDTLPLVANHFGSELQKPFNLQSLPKVLEHLRCFLGWFSRIPLSPSKQCWFIQVLQAEYNSLPLQITLWGAILHFNIVFRGEGILILLHRPESYYYRIPCIN